MKWGHRKEREGPLDMIQVSLLIMQMKEVEHRKRRQTDMCVYLSAEGGKKDTANEVSPVWGNQSVFKHHSEEGREDTAKNNCYCDVIQIALIIMPKKQVKTPLTNSPFDVYEVYLLTMQKKDMKTPQKIMVSVTSLRCLYLLRKKKVVRTTFEQWYWKVFNISGCKESRAVPSLETIKPIRAHFITL